MPRRGQRKPRQPAGDIADPLGMVRLAREFFEWLRTRNFSERTIENREAYLGSFFAWAAERGVTRPGEVTRPILERYQRHLYHHRKKNGQPLSFQSQHSHLVPVRAFFKWLARNNHILYNPASELELPRLEHRLPRHVLTANEADRVLNQADTSDPLGVRDRAIMETFYSTGMRRMELIQLTAYSIDAERGTVMIRQGKGKKDRMVPIGDRALAWVEKYGREVRPGLVVGADDGTLFLTHLGEPFTPNRMTQLVRDYVDAAKIDKRGSCHLFRHTMATLMLEGGADIRFIQAMLGHARLDTTQIYTQVSIRKPKEIHTATHPARLARSTSSAAETTAAPTVDEAPANDAARAELLASLAAEAAEEKAEV
jgi:integrase/recombinase XerD